VWQVDEKLHAARKRCSSKGWTTKAEVSLLCEFWSRLAKGEPSYRFAFNGFNAKAVYAKLKHMESILNDPKLFQMPCAAPEKQQGIIISYCKLLADSEGKAKLGKDMQGAEGFVWSKEDGAMQQCPNGLILPCTRGRTAQLSTLPLCLTNKLPLTRAADVASTPSSTSAEKEPPLAKSRGDGALQQCPNGLMAPCSHRHIAQLSMLHACLTHPTPHIQLLAVSHGRRSFGATTNFGREREVLAYWAASGVQSPMPLLS
jgi:hypothetical protein